MAHVSGLVGIHYAYRVDYMIYQISYYPFLGIESCKGDGVYSTVTSQAKTRESFQSYVHVVWE